MRSRRRPQYSSHQGGIREPVTERSRDDARRPLLAGPSFAGILLTGFVFEKAGFRELRFRLLKWRVGAHWYAAAPLIAPALMTALLLGLSLFSPEFRPGNIVSADKTVLVLAGFTIALGAGIFEEKDLLPLLEQILREAKPLLIISEDVEAEEYGPE